MAVLTEDDVRTIADYATIALDEAEDQAAAAAEAKLKAEAMACAYYPVSEKPEA